MRSTIKTQSPKPGRKKREQGKYSKTGIELKGSKGNIL